MLRRRKAADRFTPFCETLYKGYETPPHLALLHDRLERVERGDLLRLIVQMPPRHGKSVTTSELFPAYYLGRNPDRRVILTSYAGGLATSFSKRVRDHTETDRYNRIFPDVRVNRESRSSSEWDLLGHRGGMLATGVGGGITGRGADLFIIDDPLRNRADAESATIREAQWDWYTSTARTRLEPGAAFIIVLTRWHYDDIVGRILSGQDETKDEWEVISIPALAEDDDVLGRDPGEPLWPERYDKPALLKLQVEVGPRDWGSLYQQHPVATESSMFPSEKWGWYDRDDPTLSMSRGVVMSFADTAFKPGEENDYTVIATWLLLAGNVYLLGFYRGRPDFVDASNAFITQYEIYRPSTIWVEDAASGTSLVQSLRRTTNLPVMPFTIYDQKTQKQIRPTDQNKVVRAHGVTPYVHAGRVFLPRGYPGIDDFIQEHLQFPAGAHDDMVDTTVMALQKLLRELAGLGQLESEFGASPFGDEAGADIVTAGPIDAEPETFIDRDALGGSMWQ